MRITLDQKTKAEWIRLSMMTQSAAMGLNPCTVNDKLHNAVDSEPRSPVSQAYMLWIAENLAREAHYDKCYKAFDAAIDSAHNAEPFMSGIDFSHAALRHKAQAAANAGESELAIRTFQEMAESSSYKNEALFEAGLVAEEMGRDDLAASLYRSAAGKTPVPSTEDPAELARRALMRLESPNTLYARNAPSLAEALSAALTRYDTNQLTNLASQTHFAVGPVGGEIAFEEVDILSHLFDDLLESDVEVREPLVGEGAKKYLLTEGWSGQWFQGEVVFMLTRSAKGWQWTGLGICAANENWLERWRPAQRQTNQPLPISLLAPWPSQRSMMAGGLLEFFGLSHTLLITPPLFREALAFAFSNNACGFGPRGLYYNQPTTHTGVDAFSIDFTRYKKGVPFLHQSSGTPVLAPLSGVVIGASAGTTSSDPSRSNTVEIMHNDPATGTPRFMSRYLHLAGPFMLSVSTGMAVFTGQRLGLVNDTGNSVEDHLHFSVHDQTVPFPGFSGTGPSGIIRGSSVRPTPLDGVRLGDGDSGACVTSSNAERRPGLHFRPSSINFGTVQVGAIGSHDLIIENTTGSSITVSAPASRPDAIFRWDALNQTIANGASINFTIEYFPASTESNRTTLVITSTALGSPHRISIIGRGVGGDNTSPF